MNKRTIQKLSVGLLAVAVLVVPHFAHAAILDGLISLGGFSLQHFFYPLVANIASLALLVASVFLRMSAGLLNQAMYATTHIAAIVDPVTGVAAIELVWRIIRDFSSIFLIFMLLYAAITMILGIEGPSFKKLVINIVIAGLLINFSLFFTKLAVDASNVIALSFYTAIDNAADTQSSALTSTNGLANAVMQGLRIQSILYVSNGNSGDSFGGYTNGVEIKAVVVSVMGTVIVLIAALSFLAAAVMFIMRLAIIILLLAFSPIFFVGMVLPAVQPKAKEWLNTLIGQCIFAPLYLMLMYVVLRIMNDDGFAAAVGLSFGTGGSNAALSTDILGGKSVGVVMAYILIILMINMALATSKEYAGKAGEVGMKAHGWVKKNAQKWGMTGAQYVSTNTTGRVMSKLAENESFRNIAANWKVGELALKATRGAAAGYNKKLDAQVKARTEFAESVAQDKAEIGRIETQLRDLKRNRALPAYAPGSAARITLDQNIRDTQENLARAKSGEDRKIAYADRTESRTVDTLFSKVARKNKLAASKLQTPILEGRVTRHNERVEKVNNDIDSAENQLTNLQGQIAQRGAAGATTEQTQKVTDTNNRLAALRAEQRTLRGRQGAIDRMEDDIRSYRGMT